MLRTGQTEVSHVLADEIRQKEESGSYIDEQPQVQVAEEHWLRRGTLMCPGDWESFRSRYC